ncbi:MFS transporter [Nocardia sp. NBC_01503]|uniref:MFS transporter n=1 Tax=Nocardia sp. NBC_01503 TaxID=2975997 RepID=UPI002E7C406E|nr:MFS transporter [Nocardia sp. NBC_01503]WTL29220.1 MFS transporter [Nocardia sp. NBC_01503]
MRGRWAMLAVLCCSLLLVAMDATILNVALPALIDHMDPSPMEQLWIVDLYGLVLGGLLITCGAIGDRYGRKRLFLAGFVLFGLASVVAATAHTPAQLIAGRALLGVGGAMVMPSTLSLIRNIFTDDHERTQAIGIWASVAGAGAAIGPLVGGHLVEAFGWSAAFWLNVPVVVVTVTAGVWLLPEYRAPQVGRLDWFSAVLSVLGIVALAWGIKHVAKGNPAAIDVVMLAAAVLLLGFFAFRQLRSPDPLLDVRLFRNRAFTAAALATLVAMLAIGAALFLISLWLQYIHGYTPSEAGLRTVPAAIATLLGSLSTPWLMRHVGVRLLMGSALATLAVGFFVLAAIPTTTYPLVALVLVCLGIGDGIAITTAAAVLVSAVPPERAGMAGAVEETNYELGIGLGVALLGSIHGRLFVSHMTDLPLHGEQLDTARGSVGGAAYVADRVGGAQGAHILEIAQHAYDSALTTTSWISAGLVGAVAVLTVVLVPRGFTATAAH